MWCPRRCSPWSSIATAFSQNFGRIDPSDAVAPFRHAMDFKKTAGFSPADVLKPLAQLTSLASETATHRRR